MCKGLDGGDVHCILYCSLLVLYNRETQDDIWHHNINPKTICLQNLPEPVATVGVISGNIMSAVSLPEREIDVTASDVTDLAFPTLMTAKFQISDQKSS